jgi:hypothetical protein
MFALVEVITVQLQNTYIQRVILTAVGAVPFQTEEKLILPGEYSRSHVP